jgi:hypothetical protein
MSVCLSAVCLFKIFFTHSVYFHINLLILAYHSDIWSACWRTSLSVYTLTKCIVCLSDSSYLSACLLPASLCLSFCQLFRWLTSLYVYSLLFCIVCLCLRYQSVTCQTACPKAYPFIYLFILFLKFFYKILTPLYKIRMIWS